MAEIVREHEQEEAETEVLAPAQVFDPQTLALLQKTEVDQQIATAKKYPRQITKMFSTAGALVTADAETADECIYALPRGGKIIEGPSVRFAEVMAYSWGNCRCGARVIGEDQEFVTALGSFIDLEANVAIAYEVRRRITNREGTRFNADMITVTANAACSIALRNAVLRGIPKAVWRKVYAQARQCVAGDIKTLDTRRVAMVKAFELMGIKREAIFLKLGVAGVDDITLDHLVTLRGIYNAVREHETSADRAFAPEHSEGDNRLADKSKANLEKIKDKYAQPAGEGTPEKPPRKKHGARALEGTDAPKAGEPATGPQAPAPTEEPPAASTAAPPSLQAINGDVEPPAKEGPGAAGADPGPVESVPPVSDEQHGIPLMFGESEPKKS